MPYTKKIPPAVATTEVPSSTEPLLVPLSEAARLLGVRVYSIRLLTRKGVLPYRVIGNRWQIPLKALKAFAECGTATGRAA
jgi:excisionase family DNA binding protein